MPSYVLPQVLVFQEFNRQPAILTQPLRACIVGEHFALHRYTDSDEKAASAIKTTLGAAVTYDPLDDNCYPWPGRTAGEVVDQSYTRLFLDKALLQYYHEAEGSGSEVHWTSPGKNRIRAASRVFKTANGYTREASLLRDVKVGDVVRLAGYACGEDNTFETNILGLAADVIAATIEAAQTEVSNQATQTLDGSGEQTDGTENNVELVRVTMTDYDGLPDGYPSDTYTLEVIQASTGGDLTTAVLRMTSASGLDNVAAFSPTVVDADFEVGSRGLKIQFTTSGGDNMVVGQQWTLSVQQAFTRPTLASGGTYIGESDLKYIVTVNRGGLFASSTKPTVTISTTTGQDLSGPTEVTASAAVIPVGNYGVTIAFTGASLCKGDRYYIQANAEAPGAVRTLVLAHNVPDALRGLCIISESSSSSDASPDLDLTLHIKKDIEVTANRVSEAPLTNWSQSETEICLNAGIEAYDTSWVNSDGEQVALPVVSGTPYAHYRGRMPTWCSTIGSVAGDADVPAALGIVHPDNPLAYGVYKAALNANGEEVKFLGVCGDSTLDLDDWLKALKVLVGRDDVYGLCPLTQDKDVIDAFVGHVESQSTAEAGRWRIGWYNRAAVETEAVYGAGEATLATVQDDPDTTGSQYTIVESSGAAFVTNGVRATDVYRTNYVSDGFGNYTYDEFVIDEVINEETIRLLTGPSSPVNVAQKFEIWRSYSTTELSANLAQIPGLTKKRRARMVWPDELGDNGMTVKGYFFAAALAGLASGVLPHQGLTNVEVIGFDDLSRTTELFNADELNTMAASGYWIGTRDRNDGTVYSRHALTCGDQTDVNQREDSINRNVDHISYIILFAFRPYIGRANVTDVLIDTLHGELISILDAFKFTVTTKLLGPQLNAYDITELRQHPTAKDRVKAVVNITPPAPFNNLELHLVVN